VGVSPRSSGTQNLSRGAASFAPNYNNHSMNKKASTSNKEYDLSRLGPGVRGKYYQQAAAGTNLVLLEPDLARIFRDSKSVNRHHPPRVQEDHPLRRLTRRLLFSHSPEAASPCPSVAASWFFYPLSTSH